MSVETARSTTFSASAREIKSSDNAGERIAARLRGVRGTPLFALAAAALLLRIAVPFVTN
jgi:hypothetical protein